MHANDPLIDAFDTRRNVQFGVCVCVCVLVRVHSQLSLICTWIN